MITGSVTADYEAVIALRIKGPAADAYEVEAIIDTGFNGFLTLPPASVTALGLTRLSRGRGQLADGSEQLFDICGVTVFWDGQQRYVEVDVLDTSPLVGMSLLDGYDLHIQVREGGRVAIQASGQNGLS